MPVVGREMSKDVTFDGHVMPKGKVQMGFLYALWTLFVGTKVAFSVYALHHHAGVWGDDVEVSMLA